MGSFNRSCAATNVSIEYGNPVVGMFLKKKPYEDSFDEIDARHFIVSFPIRGTYDDYGRIQNIDKSDPVIEDIVHHMINTDLETAVDACADDLMLFHARVFDAFPRLVELDPWFSQVNKRIDERLQTAMSEISTDSSKFPEIQEFRRDEAIRKFLGLNAINWKKFFTEYPNHLPMMKDVIRVQIASRILGFRIAPSRYDGQQNQHEARRALAELALSILDEQSKEIT